MPLFGFLRLKFLLPKEEDTARIDFLSALRISLPCSDSCHETTTSFAFVALTGNRASSMAVVVKALYSALHGTSRRNVDTFVDW